jgi:hypothetical protein
MAFTREQWLAKREKGLGRYLALDGIIFTGGPFAVLMQAIGFVFLRDEGQTFGQYFMLPMTWVRFFLHGILFGLIVGYINWRRNETAFPAADERS